MSKKINKKSKGLRSDFNSTSSFRAVKSRKSLPYVDEPVKFLSTTSIPLHQDNDAYLSEDLLVPPTSPRDLISDCEVTPVPRNLPRITTIPWVREIGVKETIKKLSDVYGCEQFNWNLIQFWFLDFVTDCLWRLQDEYQFPENYQKVILDWILYVFNLIRATDLDLTRQQIIKIFGEAISAAERFIENGAALIPHPEELFELKVDDLAQPVTIGSPQMASDTESVSRSCSLSISSDEDVPQNENSYLAIECKDGLKFYDLPPKLCPWDTDEDCLSSSIETASEDEMILVKKESINATVEEEENADLMYEDFYKPDLRTPPRFKASSESIFDDISSISNSYESCSVEVEEEQKAATFAPNWFIAKRKYPDVPCPSKIFEIQSEGNIEVDEKKKEEEVLQSWFDYHLWQLRKADMDDPKIGWLSLSDVEFESVEPISFFDSATELAQKKLFDYLMESKDRMKEARKNYFINSCALMAIKQIVREYFFGTFQFSLLKTAYRYPQYLITQELNRIWYIPKKFKGEIKRPKPRKPKKEKVKKEKKPKKEKGSKKSSKSSKKSSKKSKSSKDSKKSKSSKESKKSKKGGKAKEKKPGLTKQEKAEMARLQAEMKLREEMERKAEENKLFVFPLTDAAEDSFFENIFTNWVKPKKAKDGKKAKVDTKTKKKSKK
ncbi:uncharacterized protein LOC130900516 [Diorhabda carinulata]|uniref:uncharacterized protein LOC130900516 n=1 Tax=Diorhabda carinulata TaxID=1163345 RepID=UPI0025A2B0D1|nr:uncharacterized protein LOC130900516 [Diorhabda carinulata]